MSFKNKIFSIILIVLALLIGNAFLRGPLFAISPVKLNFESKDTGNAKLFYHPGTNLAGFENIEELIKETERFHELKFRKPVRVIICNSMEEYRRFTGGSATAITRAYPGAIYFSPKRKGRKNGLIMKLKISNLILYQHMSPLGGIKFPNWFLEGLAVHYGNQKDYMSREELKSCVKEGLFVYPQDYGTWLSNKLRGKKEYIKALCKEHPDWAYFFIYAEFGFLVEDLVCDYGKDKVILFMKRLLKRQTPEKHFKDIFHISLEDYVLRFKKRLEK